MRRILHVDSDHTRYDRCQHAGMLSVTDQLFWINTEPREGQSARRKSKSSSSTHEWSEKVASATHVNVQTAKRSTMLRNIVTFIVLKCSAIKQKVHYGLSSRWGSFILGIHPTGAKPLGPGTQLDMCPLSPAIVGQCWRTG